MASHFTHTIPTRLPMWQRVRQYAVPPSMIETATARRAAGDWAGACAAARVDVDLDLRAVRDRHGTEFVTRLRADLRRLAPDLLRWHMPRIAPDGRLRPGLTLSLARYPDAGGGPVQLVVRTPPAWADAGQRMSLALWEESGSSDPGHHPHPHPDRRFRLDLHRHLWDADRSGELTRRGAAGAGAGASRLPGFAGDGERWAAGGAPGLAPSGGSRAAGGAPGSAWPGGSGAAEGMPDSAGGGGSWAAKDAPGLAWSRGSCTAEGIPDAAGGGESCPAGTTSEASSVAAERAVGAGSDYAWAGHGCATGAAIDPSPVPAGRAAGVRADSSWATARSATGTAHDFPGIPTSWTTDAAPDSSWGMTRSATGTAHDSPDIPTSWTTDATPGSSWATAGWAAEAELLLRAEGRSRGAFTVRLGARRWAVFELVAPDDSHVPTIRPVRQELPPQEIAALPVLPEAAARVLPDLELLRAGLITADRLHPLVAAALAPMAPAPPPAPVSRPAGEPRDPHRVECRGEVHRIALRDGVLTAIDHGPDELRREELLVALGGPALPCLRAIDAVHRTPESLPAVRERLAHGDVAGALAVVEGLLGPAALLRDGPLREELESAAAGRIEHGLFRSGLVAVHPAAAAPAEHRPRLDRRTPSVWRFKRNSPGRPRTALPF
ncbi:hypothetical protein [Streptomyces sp. YS415]|uniref:hypothetical protein n=1 Tax=Streptomyces sp. YS415 TaxID=2944806 RepID=UPI00202019B9|nr:hypothetical protein [Streptomyces sp. YS415]MCL7424563.1 hypothetical protein [Streptomyces sp. YS415]